MKSMILTFALALPAYGISTSATIAADDLSENTTNVPVNSALLDTVAAALPERSTVNPAYLESAFNPNISLTENAHVGVTFLDEGAGFRNTFGYFTYTADAFSGVTRGDIDTDGSGIVSLRELQNVNGVSNVSFIFNNASEVGGGGSLRTGDSVVLGGGTIETNDAGELVMSGGTIFGANDNIGFFLGANTYNRSGVEGWDTEGDPNFYFSMDFINPEAVATATLDDAGDLTRHVAMGFADENYSEIIVGFEDLDRRYGSDDDFNDLVFKVWTDPVTAIANNNIDNFYTYTAPAPVLGQGALGLILATCGVMGWRKRSKR